MKRIFVDTSAFFALADETDTNHQEAKRLSKKIGKEKLEVVISDHILSETITLIRIKIGFQKALLFGNRLFDSKITNLIVTEEKMLKEGWNIFSKYDDKNFSFVDCISFAIMMKEGIDTAFTFDHHFEQIGFKILI